MKTMIKNNNLNSLSKIAFLMNIPLVLLYLPICFIYSDTQGVLLQGINFILCVVLFAFYFVTLLFIGREVEIVFTKKKYLIIYLLSGIAGSILSLAFNHNTVCAGASGAIFGLLGV